MWTETAFMQLPKRNRTNKRNVFAAFLSLLHSRGRDMLVFVFFLAISFGFWILQRLDDTFETDLMVPMELVGVPKGVLITSSLPKEITITVEDRGTNIFNYLFNSESISPIRIDFATYDSGALTGKASIPAADVQRLFLQQMASSLQVVRLRPGKFEFHYNRGLSRRLPVGFVGALETRKQNYLQDISLSPDSVLVYAPASILDTMRYAYTQRLEVSELSKTSTFNVDFTKSTGVMMVPETIKVTAHVDYYTEQSVKVPIIGLNFPADMSLKTFPAMVTVKYRVGASNAGLIHADNFVLAASYEELLANKHQKYRPQLRSTPLGVSHVRITPQEVDYLLEYTSGKTPDDTNDTQND